MMTSRDPGDRRAMRSILAKLYAVNSYYAYQDFRRTNPENRKKFDKRGNPVAPKSYTLSPLTLEAREHYTMAQRVIWSNEAENQIKAYIGRLRTSGELDKILGWEQDNNRVNGNPWIREGDQNGYEAADAD